MQTAATSFGVELSPIGVRDADEIERAITAFARGSNRGLIMTASPLVLIHRDLINHACRPAQVACHIFGSCLHLRRRPDLLRD